MKDVHLLVWLTQLGLSVAVPLVGFLALALWLRDSCGWGQWVLWVGIGVGLIAALDGLVNSIRTMNRMAKAKDKPEEPPLSFNEHE